MRKRKKPTLLLTVLGLCVGVIAIMGMPKFGGNTPPPDNHSPESQVGNDVKTPKQSEIVANVKEKVAGGKKEKPARPEAPDGPPGMPHPPKREGPLALKEKPKPYNPTPNDSATSQQWYR